jgi:hypothetical protein
MSDILISGTGIIDFEEGGRMKRIIELSIIFIGLLAVGLIAGPSVVLKVKVQTANIHSEPVMSSGVIAQVIIGTIHESSNKVGEFYEILITDKDGKTVYGFLHSSMVEVFGTEGGEVTTESIAVPRTGHLPGKPNPYKTHILISGIGFGLSWAATVVVSLAIGDDFFGTTIIPVAGPFVTIARIESGRGYYKQGGKGMLIASGIAQVGFLTYFIISAARNGSYNNSYNKKLVIMPSAMPAGIMISYRF